MTITITTPANGATYGQFQKVNASYSCTAALGAPRIVSCVGDVRNRTAIDTAAPGPHTFTVTATNRAGERAQKTASYTVTPAALAGGGAFVIGDQNAALGTSVTFWGAKWSRRNTLSGGAPPTAFKGYADFVPDPLSSGCGGTWTTRPGDSSQPPGNVPATITVIVASHTSQSSDVIGGDIAKVVVVQTRAGYDGNPGHAGTGTVIAAGSAPTLCG